jgi:hypothetical protein
LKYNKVHEPRYHSGSFPSCSGNQFQAVQSPYLDVEGLTRNGRIGTFDVIV